MFNINCFCNSDIYKGLYLYTIEFKPDAMFCAALQCHAFEISDSFVHQVSIMFVVEASQILAF